MGVRSDRTVLTAPVVRTFVTTCLDGRTTGPLFITRTGKRQQAFGAVKLAGLTIVKNQAA
jgi:hypothetical protein